MPQAPITLSYSKERVVILAGGPGTRMGSLTRERQKCCFQVDEEPLITRIVDRLATIFPALHLLIAVQHQAREVLETVIPHIKRNPNISAEFIPHPPGAELIGAYVSMRRVLTGPAPFMRVSGDILAPIETYRSSWELSKTSGLPLTVTANSHHMADTHFLMQPSPTHPTLLGKYAKPQELQPDQKSSWLCDMSIMCWQNPGLLFELIDALYPVTHGKSSFEHVDYLRQKNEVALNVSLNPWQHLGSPTDLHHSLSPAPTSATTSSSAR